MLTRLRTGVDNHQRARGPAGARTRGLLARATIAATCCLALAGAALAPAASAATPAGYVVVNSGPISSPGLSTTTGHVSCPVTSAGVQTYPQGGGVTFGSRSLYANVDASFPAGAQWWATVKNRGPATTFSVWAVCAVPNPGYVEVYNNGTTNAPGSLTQATEACPAGTKLIGGGVTNTSSLPTVYDSYPSGNSWVVDVNNPGTTTNNIYVAAICATFSNTTAYSVNQGPAVRALTSSVTGASISCPAGQAALGGGISVGSLGTGVSLNSTAPIATGSGWTSLEDNGSPYSIGLTPWVICAS